MDCSIIDIYLTYTGQDKFVGSIICSRDSGGIGTMSWQFENQTKLDYLAVLALDYALHALDLLQEDDGLSSSSLCQTNDDTTVGAGIGTLYSESTAVARLHYLAARLLLNMDDPTGALVHLKIAYAQTKMWPSLHLSIQRVLFACTERCDMERTNPSLDAHNSCIELLLRREISVARALLCTIWNLFLQEYTKSG